MVMEEHTKTFRGTGKITNKNMETSMKAEECHTLSGYEIKQIQKFKKKHRNKTTHKKIIPTHQQYKKMENSGKIEECIILLGHEIKQRNSRKRMVTKQQGKKSFLHTSNRKRKIYGKFCES